MFDEIIKQIREIYNTDKFIPLHAPKFIGEEKKYVNSCIDSSFVSSVGKYVNDFEEEVARYTKSKFAVATVNGTSALHIALLLAGVKENDLVITQPLTFVATANAIRYLNADPVFIDVDSDTLGLSSEKLESFLKEETTYSNGQLIHTKSKRIIRACLPMHTYGHPCKIDEIVNICREFNIQVVEDAAESLGSFYKNKHTGTYADIGVLSFNGNKIITTGGGGIILTDIEKIAQKAKHLTTQAKSPHDWEYIHDDIGYNYRLTNIHAALGVAQMEYLNDIIINKREIASTYFSFFKHLGVPFFTEPQDCHSNYWLNVIFLNDKKERDQFLSYSNKMHVMTRPAWRLINNLKMYEDCITYNIDNAKKIADTLVNIPSSHTLM